MSAIHLGDLPTWIAGLGSLAAVGTALWIAHDGNTKNNAHRAEDRRQAVADLNEERQRGDKILVEERAIAQDNLAEERELAAAQRRADHLTRLLLEVYDLYGASVGTSVPATRNEALFRIRPRLAVLPPELAVAVRIGVSDTTSTESRRNKESWLRHRLGLPQVPKSNEITWEILSREAEFDLWWVQTLNAPRLDRQPYPWHDFDTLRNSED
jgi:hypothetical protein